MYVYVNMYIYSPGIATIFHRQQDCNLWKKGLDRLNKNPWRIFLDLVLVIKTMYEAQFS